VFSTSFFSLIIKTSDEAKKSQSLLKILDSQTVHFLVISKSHFSNFHLLGKTEIFAISQTISLFFIFETFNKFISEFSI